MEKPLGSSGVINLRVLPSPLRDPIRCAAKAVRAFHLSTALVADLHGIIESSPRSFSDLETHSFPCNRVVFLWPDTFHFALVTLSASVRFVGCDRRFHVRYGLTCYVLYSDRLF